MAKAQPLGEYIAERKKAKKGPKVLRDIRSSNAENGGFVAEHTFHSNGGMDGYHEPEQHVFGADQGTDFLKHLASAHGIKNVAINATSTKNEQKMDEEEEAGEKEA